MTVEPLSDAIDDLVSHYRDHSSAFTQFLENLRILFAESAELRPFIHSMRWRTKDPEHLRAKLQRKAGQAAAAGVPFEITRENLFEKITDLAGFRILHLHTSEFGEMNAAILRLLEENRYDIVEGPTARTWDQEYQDFFTQLGINTIASPRMYTSVHYVIEANRKTKYTGEIQVRTLAEELWGEVDHKINYPSPSIKIACREQIKVLARLTSTCTRLVDSIFRTHLSDASANDRD